MRKSALCAFALAVIACAAWSQEGDALNQPPTTTGSGGTPIGQFSVKSGAGLYYDAKPLPGNTLDIIAIATNIRLGGWADATYRITQDLSVGVEIGVQYFYIEVTVDDTSERFSLLDIPVNAKYSLEFGVLVLEGFAGLFVEGAIAPSVFDFYANVDAGARLVLGALYIEGSYVATFRKAAAGFARFGSGFTFRLY